MTYTRASAKAAGSKGWRSSIPSPRPTYFTGTPISLAMAKTTPPLAVPSSLVSTMPVIPALWLNCLAWIRPFCPVVASRTSRTSLELLSPSPVSYTHLDVYKRQS